MSNPVFDRAFIRNSALILASESWADGYMKTPEIHGKLLKQNARLQRKILDFFKDEAKRIDHFINWSAYSAALSEVKATRVDAYDISVIVDSDVIAKGNDTFVKVVFDQIAGSTTLGAQAGEIIYKRALGIQQGDSPMQELIWQQVARLVGKKVGKDGTLIDNPRAEFRISDKTRDDIKSTIINSLNLGEDVQTATKRLEGTIKNSARAEAIANTETVNAYNAGLKHFGKQSGAIGKEWSDNGAEDVCAEYADLGPVEFEFDYGDGVTEPAAHPNCRCYIRLIYQNELDANPDLFG